VSTKDMTTDEAGARRRFPPSLVYQAARLYYLQQATQAEIAEQLGTSRPTVSRLLAEARDTGVVQVQVRDPEQTAMVDLELALVDALGLQRAYVTPASKGMPLGSLLGPGVAEALLDARLRPGDALLVSSGATVYAVAQQTLPSLPGVVLCPTVGGVEEPEAQYQTNEITRGLAMRVDGSPVMLYAPAMPTPALHRVLLKDPQLTRVTELWSSARAALLGIGGPPHHRSSLPSVISQTATAQSGAAGDICARPYDRSGRPIKFPGVERLVAMNLADLRRIPHSIAAAVGQGKVQSILVAARAGYVNTLVTDSTTAEHLIDAAQDQPQ
jgi:DNA-binding transcriptional regulator LsrR (DeoR family)